MNIELMPNNLKDSIFRSY